MSVRYSDLAEDIKTKLTAVAGTGIIHTYERQTASPAKFIELFTSSGKVCGWEITRSGVTEHKRGANFRHHRFQLKGYLGLQDAGATAVTFQDLVDAICDKLRHADPEAAGASWYYKNGDDDTAAAAQVLIINDRMFGNVLCHCAEISLSITERIT